MNDQQPPVNAGEEIEVTIQAVGEKGDGIAKKDGFVLFVPDTKKGERVKIKITKVLRSVGFAEVVERLGKAKVEERPKRPSVEDIPDVDPEPSPQDSDDFGADLDEDE